MLTHSGSHIFRKAFSLSFLMAMLLFVSCVAGDGGRRSSSKSNSNLSGSGNTGSGAGSLPNDTGLGESGTLQSVKIELSHLIDPFDGTYKKKLSIPKNYKGFLYLAGLNVSALQDKIIKVRFNFGIDRQEIVLDATVARAPGIVPQTDIQVLMVDMTKTPFARTRLPYDLYDYNDYAADPTKAPVINPRDGQLYCRGLQLADDPTFDTTSSSAFCSGTNDKCLYAYAKIVDATLYNTSGIANIPTRPQIWTEASGVRSPSPTTAASTMCLPDYEDVNGVNTLLGLAPPLSGLVYDTPILGRLYRGPYRAIDSSSWSIKSNAIFNNKKGLFEVSFDSLTGYRSFLFPRAGKAKLGANINYQGSDDFFGLRGNKVSTTSGTTAYMDGCNIRTLEYDVSTAETIGSCNVNASIDIFYLNADGAPVNITTDKSIKLQLLRSSLTDNEGKEVLTTAFKRCDSSSTCGSDECCYNSRCWSKDLVSQCIDKTPIVGNQPIGNSCVSDYECSSLCCDSSRGACAAHNPSGTPAISCGKTSGQSCVSREFCKPEFVPTCKMYKTGVNTSGVATCEMRCPPIETYGDCKAGLCTPPVVPPVPTIDPANPCAGAIDP